MSLEDNSSTFTPLHPFNLEDPKTWAETIGKMDWDETHICFTKRSLLDFLKNAGVTVGINFQELQKLPKYATFGKFSQAATDAAVQDLVEAEIADPKHEDDRPRPSRKVAQPPGGESSIQFSEYEHVDALSMAPPRPGSAPRSGSKEGGAEEITYSHTDRVVVGDGRFPDRNQQSVPDNNAFRPTRKVRENPGGNSTLQNMFNGN